MSVDLLRRAAALMRERAEAATPAPWRCDPEQSRSTRPADCYDVIDESTFPVDGGANHFHPDATHIASWHPAVALAVADWIDSHARDLASADGHLPSCDSPGDVQQAIVVARAYLGESA